MLAIPAEQHKMAADGLLEHEKSELLLAPNSERFCMFPIKEPAIWEMYKKVSARRGACWRARRSSYA